MLLLLLPLLMVSAGGDTVEIQKEKASSWDFISQ